MTLTKVTKINEIHSSDWQHKCLVNTLRQTMFWVDRLKLKLENV